jgi:hypothetical protein
MNRKHLKRLALAAAALLGAIQLVPVERTTRLGAGDPVAPPQVRWVLRRACYDCHSTETRWPIWAYVAPISWQVVADVNRAREVLNLSDWAAYDEERRYGLRAAIAPVTETHRMPLWYYVTLHPDARLSLDELAALGEWSRAAEQERTVTR